MDDLTASLKHRAHELGFVLAGVTLAAEPGRLAHFHRWLAAGFAGQMHYLEQRREAYRHPHSVLEGCRTILMLALPYTTEHSSAADETPLPGRAKVARYARGSRDYHDVIHERLQALQSWLLERCPAGHVRGVVDTAPLLEREFAEAAGLGWVGKNTLLLNRRWGSYFFLAALLTDLELTVDAADRHSYCGTCTACLQACPTQAFPQPFVLDATRCISYLTIEHRQAIETDLAERLQDWAFGCDICQEVCPWNRKAEVGDEADFEPRGDLETLDLLATLELDEDGFRSRFRRTPLWRAKRRGILRNAILLAGNQRLQTADPPLRGLLRDPEPLVRSAAAWALAKIGVAGWREAVEAVAREERDEEVRAALLRSCGAPPADADR